MTTVVRSLSQANANCARIKSDSHYNNSSFICPIKMYCVTFPSRSHARIRRFVCSNWPIFFQRKILIQSCETVRCSTLCDKSEISGVSNTHCSDFHELTNSDYIINILRYEIVSLSYFCIIIRNFYSGSFHTIFSKADTFLIDFVY